MFQDPKPREALVSTGVPWLPHAPTDWSLVRLKRLMHEEQSLVGDAWSETALLALTKRGVVSRDINNLEGKVPASFAGYQVLEPSNLVFCLFDIDETPRTVGLAASRGMITAAYTRFKVMSGANPRYLELLFATLDDRKLLRPLYTGLRKSIRAADLLSTSIPLPSAEEQEAIVTYLAHAHERIGLAIRNKQRLASLLAEQRRVMINRMVVRGVDPDVRLSDTGNRFIGEVPAHWKTCRFSTLARPVQRTGFATESLLSVYLGRGVVRYEEGGKRVHAPSTDLTAYQLVKPGDLVMNNQQAWRGSVGVSHVRGIVSPAYLVAKVSNSLDPAYARFLFAARPMVDQYVLASKGVGDIQRTIHWPYLRNVQVPVPPLPEQQEIVDRLGEALSRTDAALAKVTREVELLEEFRGRLTADVVTGQVDVRSIAASLPSIDVEMKFEASADAVDLDDDEKADEAGMGEK